MTNLDREYNELTKNKIFPSFGMLILVGFPLGLAVWLVPLYHVEVIGIGWSFAIIIAIITMLCLISSIVGESSQCKKNNL